MHHPASEHWQWQHFLLCQRSEVKLNQLCGRHYTGMDNSRIIRWMKIKSALWTNPVAGNKQIKNIILPGGQKVIPEGCYGNT